MKEFVKMPKSVLQTYYNTYIRVLLFGRISLKSTQQSTRTLTFLAFYKLNSIVV